MNPKLVIPRCIVTKIYHAEKSNKDYLTIETGDSTFNLGSGDLDLSKTPTLIPMSIEAEIGAFVFGRNQALTCRTFKAVPI